MCTRHCAISLENKKEELVPLKSLADSEWDRHSETVQIKKIMTKLKINESCIFPCVFLSDLFQTEEAGDCWSLGREPHSQEGPRWSEDQTGEWLWGPAGEVGP